jgi:hypothetical protein
MVFSQQTRNEVLLQLRENNTKDRTLLFKTAAKFIQTHYSFSEFDCFDDLQSCYDAVVSDLVNDSGSAFYIYG